VVELLKGLSKQVEKEGKAEEDLFESFVCWGKSVIAQKTDSNSAAQSRIDSLTTYIADLGAGKIELTTERVDLEKEIAGMSADLEQAKALRDRENQDFNSAKAEMSQAKAALASGMKVLGEATKDHKGSLMSFKNELNGGLSSMEAESASLNKAVELGDRFLDKADGLFLRRLLTGDVPARDEKKLRRKADFKMSYKARSTKIQDVLSKLHGTFSKNLNDAEAKEKAAQASYDTLSKSKGAQLKAAQDALIKGEVEGGSRGVSKQNAEDEVAALTKQVSEDNKFIKQTTDSLAEKKTEWGKRSDLRAGELAAISKAVGILYSDDARDNFKKSYSSQGLFLQTRTDAESDLQTTSKAMAMLGGAATELKKIAFQTGDRRLSALAALAAQGAADPSAKAKFGPVLAAVDTMIGILKSEEQKDLETKESCEQDRMENSRKALLSAKDIDEKTDNIAKLEGEIKEMKVQIDSLVASKKKANEELGAAAKIRSAETAQWTITNKEDQDAALTVKSAMKVLADYYKDNFKASLVQQKRPTVVAGEAPPPPAATWSGSYGVKKDESTGIIAMLEMVHEDILKDATTAKAEEAQAQKEFNTFKSTTEGQMKELQSQIDKQTGTMGEKDLSKTSTAKQRATEHGEWNAIMKTMKDIAPNCEYFTVNYKLRVSNRQIELDGLTNAKAILNGGSFKK